jgi:hypothetical protein
VSYWKEWEKSPDITSISLASLQEMVERAVNTPEPLHFVSQREFDRLVKQGFINPDGSLKDGQQ